MSKSKKSRLEIDLKDGDDPLDIPLFTLDPKQRNKVLSASWPGKGLPPKDVARYVKYCTTTGQELEWGWIKGEDSALEPDELWKPAEGWPTLDSVPGPVDIMKFPLRKVIPDFVERAIRWSREDYFSADVRKLVTEAIKAVMNFAKHLRATRRAFDILTTSVSPLLGLPEHEPIELPDLTPLGSLSWDDDRPIDPRWPPVRLSPDLFPESRQLAPLIKQLRSLRHDARRLMGAHEDVTGSKVVLGMQLVRVTYEIDQLANRLTTWANSGAMTAQGRPKDRPKMFLMHAACWFYDSAVGWWIADFAREAYKPQRRLFTAEVIVTAGYNLSKHEHSALDNKLPPIPEQIDRYLKKLRAKRK